MSSRFTLESDFVDSFINYFVLDNYKNEEFSVVADSNVYEQCMNLNNNILKTVNCGARGEKVSNYIESLGEEFTKIKEAATGNCSAQILKAHNLRYNINKGSNENNRFLNNLTISTYRDKSAELRQCIDAAML
jgi:hypothetical protein